MICWIESVDPVDDLCLTNQIYSALLNAFEFKEITEAHNAHLKMLPENDETRPRGCRMTATQQHLCLCQIFNFSSIGGLRHSKIFVNRECQSHGNKHQRLRAVRKEGYMRSQE